MPDTSPLPLISVSVKDAAAMTGLSKWTIYKRLDEGVLLSAYDGSRRLVLVDSLHAYIKGLPAEREASA